MKKTYTISKQLRNLEIEQPAFVGTEKQVAWAEKIWNDAVKNIVRSLDEAGYADEDYINDCNDDEKEDLAAFAEARISKMVAEKSAAKWINDLKNNEWWSMSHIAEIIETFNAAE